MQPLRVAALVKQVPKFEAMSLGPDGRLIRDGLELELSAYCRRAVSKAVELAVETGGTATIATLGPPSADDAVREAVAWGLAAGADVTGLHLCGPEFAGSDTLATARALAALLQREGPFDLVLVGRNSIDAETGQVGPELAELLDYPFVAGVRHLELRGRALAVRCERDDGWQDATVSLPAVASVAERLCEPAKVPPAWRAEVPSEHLRRLCGDDMGDHVWGQAASATVVGRTRVFDVPRLRRRLDGPLATSVATAVEMLVERGALDDVGVDDALPVLSARPSTGPVVAVLLEPDRARHARELLGAAAVLATDVGGHVVALDTGDTGAELLSSWGADAVLGVRGALVEEDAAGALSPWVAESQPWAVLAPGTLWGREVAARLAARIGAGLTGDAVAVEVEDGELIAWKPAFGGRLVAAVSATSPVHFVTVRPGVLPLLTPRAAAAVPAQELVATPLGRVVVSGSGRDDDVDVLARASRVVGVGTGVPLEDYPLLQPLLTALDAELGATRKITDDGWLPRARQIGITGRSIAPQLYVALGIQGKFNHMVGVRAAGTVLAVNLDPTAPVFDVADIGIVGDWRDVVPALAAGISARRLVPAS